MPGLWHISSPDPLVLKRPSNLRWSRSSSALATQDSLASQALIIGFHHLPQQRSRLRTWEWSAGPLSFTKSGAGWRAPSSGNQRPRQLLLFLCSLNACCVAQRSSKGRGALPRPRPRRRRVCIHTHATSSTRASGLPPQLHPSGDPISQTTTIIDHY